MRRALLGLGLLALALLTGLDRPARASDTRLDTPGNFNPLVPGYFADPTVKQFGDTFYIYATTDGNGGGRGPAVAWVSKDFVNWVLVPMNWPTTPHYWAPDVVQRPDGRFYLYYSQPCSIYCGVSDSPIGPWIPIIPGDGLVIPDRIIKDVITLDLQTFEDRDGTLYGYWGTWGIFPNSGCGIGVFNTDMKSFARFGMIPNTQAKDFFEAPFMIERDGVYYFTYSSGSCHDASYRVQYAVSDRPDGQFRMGPNNPILASSSDRTVHGPGHHSILQNDDNYYIIYHRHDIPVTPNGMHRQICADPLIFEGAGVIRRVEPTHRGIGYLGPRVRSPNLAAGKPVTASSYYHDSLRDHHYRPEYAVDDNNATLWRPADQRPGHWLQVDLGGPCRVRHVETQFEYGTWAYQYLIEHSLDAQQWQVFADRRQNGRWGSPLVDQGDVEARYLRLTVTGTEYPGLFGAVWNFKAFSAQPDDPLLTMADQAFAQVNGHAARGGGATDLGSGHTASLDPLVHLDVVDLQLGTPVDTWINQGSMSGEFRSDGPPPVVGMAAGRKGLRFAGQQMLTASMPAPRALAGNSSYTVAAWVNNPEIDESECIVSWAGRGGPDATTAQFGYGSHRAFGAVGHWGFADMGFREEPPQAGLWHHLAVVFDGVIERVYVNGVLNNAAPKMLLMHAGRPIHVGASVPGSEHFDGFLASLRIYDRALSESEVQQLAADAPSADVVLHVDSGQLDFGPLRQWPNQGALGGALIATSDPPEVAAVAGRISVQFASQQSLQWQVPEPIALADCTLLLGMIQSSQEPGGTVIEFLDAEGESVPVLAPPPAAGWQQLAVVYRAGEGSLFVDGVRQTGATPRPPATLRAVRLNGTGDFSGAVTRVQLFHRSLADNELSQMFDVWKSEWRTPQPDPAAFADGPLAVSPTTALMTARSGASPMGRVEYLFRELGERSTAGQSGWSSVPHFLVDGLVSDTSYCYSVVVRDALGNVTAPSPPAAFRTDRSLFRTWSADFGTTRDVLASGVAGTIWDGLLSDRDGSRPESVRIEAGKLTLQSSGTVWDGGTPRGAFLYRRVSGDFVVEAHVADYTGLATRRVPGNNDGGLMVRVGESAEAGPGEDLLQLNFFPIWNQGNMVTNLDGGARRQTGNQLAWDAHRHLQIVRQGPRFHFRTSPDGQQWTEMPGSPVEREDMQNVSLQVGLYHASYGGESSSVSFDQFRLIVPQ